jgi:hypothetical protein
MTIPRTLSREKNPSGGSTGSIGLSVSMLTAGHDTLTTRPSATASPTVLHLGTEIRCFSERRESPSLHDGSHLVGPGGRWAASPLWCPPQFVTGDIMPDQSHSGRSYHYTVTWTMPSRRRREDSTDDSSPQRVDERWTDPDGNEVSRDDPDLQAAISATIAPIQIKLLTENLKLPFWALEKLSPDELRAGLALVLSDDQEERQRSREILLAGVKRLIAEARLPSATRAAGEQDASSAECQRPSTEPADGTAASKRRRSRPWKSER